MTTAAFAPLHGSRAPDNRRFLVSLGVSAATHAIALAIFAGLLMPIPAPVWVRLGQPAVVQVVLSAPEPVAAAPGGATRVDAAPPQPKPEPVAPPLPAPKAAEPTPEPTISLRKTDPRPAASPATGSDTPIAPTPEAVPDDAPTPPGDVAVGAAESAEPLGHTQATRLAQRFPQRVYKPPRLKAPLVVPYPVRAARTWREARIAVLLIVDSDGKVLEATLSPEDPLFSPTVRDAIDSAAFLPAEAEADGAAVAYWVIVEFVFTMRKPRPAKSPATG
jgi:hypothetical protein